MLLWHQLSLRRSPTWTARSQQHRTHGCATRCAACDQETMFREESPSLGNTKAFCSLVEKGQRSLFITRDDSGQAVQISTRSYRLCLSNAGSISLDRRARLQVSRSSKHGGEESLIIVVRRLSATQQIWSIWWMLGGPPGFNPQRKRRKGRIKYAAAQGRQWLFGGLCQAGRFNITGKAFQRRAWSHTSSLCSGH